MICIFFTQAKPFNWITIQNGHKWKLFHNVGVIFSNMINYVSTIYNVPVFIEHWYLNINNYETVKEGLQTV